MIQRVRTATGDHWAIVLNNRSLEDVLHMQTGLVNLMIAATGSELLPDNENCFFDTLSLLSEFFLTDEQMMLCEDNLIDLEIV